MAEWLDMLKETRTIVIIAIVAATLFLSRYVKYLVKKHSKEGGAGATNYRFLGHLVSAMVYLIGIGIIIYMVPSLRALSVSLLAGAGILAVVIGFASQQAFSNVISGIFIIASKPYRVGDWLKVKDEMGIVEDITLRHTVIKTFENKRVMIPNAVMNNEVIENAHIGDERICKFVEIGISYDSDIDRAIKIMREEAEKHPDSIDNRTAAQKKKKEPMVPVKVIGLEDSSVKLRAWVWAKNPSKGFSMACDLRKRIKERFDREGVEIPFPYMTIVYKKNLPKPRKLKK